MLGAGGLPFGDLAKELDAITRVNEKRRKALDQRLVKSFYAESKSDTPPLKAREVFWDETLLQRVPEGRIPDLFASLNEADHLLVFPRNVDLDDPDLHSPTCLRWNGLRDSDFDILPVHSQVIRMHTPFLCDRNRWQNVDMGDRGVMRCTVIRNASLRCFRLFIRLLYLKTANVFFDRGLVDVTLSDLVLRTAVDRLFDTLEEHRKITLVPLAVLAMQYQVQWLRDRCISVLQKVEVLGAALSTASSPSGRGLLPIAKPTVDNVLQYVCRHGLPWELCIEGVPRGTDVPADQQLQFDTVDGPPKFAFRVRTHELGRSYIRIILNSFDPVAVRATNPHRLLSNYALRYNHIANALFTHMRWWHAQSSGSNSVSSAEPRLPACPGAPPVCFGTLPPSVVLEFVMTHRGLRQPGFLIHGSLLLWAKSRCVWLYYYHVIEFYRQYRQLVELTRSEDDATLGSYPLDILPTPSGSAPGPVVSQATVRRMLWPILPYVRLADCAMRVLCGAVAESRIFLSVELNRAIESIAIKTSDFSRSVRPRETWKPYYTFYQPSADSDAEGQEESKGTVPQQDSSFGGSSVQGSNVSETGEQKSLGNEAAEASVGRSVGADGTSSSFDIGMLNSVILHDWLKGNQPCSSNAGCEGSTGSLLDAMTSDHTSLETALSDDARHDPRNVGSISQLRRDQLSRYAVAVFAHLSQISRVSHYSFELGAYMADNQLSSTASVGLLRGRSVAAWRKRLHAACNTFEYPTPPSPECEDPWDSRGLFHTYVLTELSQRLPRLKVAVEKLTAVNATTRTDEVGPESKHWRLPSKDVVRCLSQDMREWWQVGDVEDEKGFDRLMRSSAEYENLLALGEGYSVLAWIEAIMCSESESTESSRALRFLDIPPWRQHTNALGSEQDHDSARDIAQEHSFLRRHVKPADASRLPIHGLVSSVRMPKRMVPCADAATSSSRSSPFQPAALLRQFGGVEMYSTVAPRGAWQSGRRPMHFCSPNAEYRLILRFDASKSKFHTPFIYSAVRKAFVEGAFTPHRPSVYVPQVRSTTTFMLLRTNKGIFGLLTDRLMSTNSDDHPSMRSALVSFGTRYGAPVVSSTNRSHSLVTFNNGSMLYGRNTQVRFSVQDLFVPGRVRNHPFVNHWSPCPIASGTIARNVFIPTSLNRWFKSSWRAKVFMVEIFAVVPR